MTEPMRIGIHVAGAMMQIILFSAVTPVAGAQGPTVPPAAASISIATREWIGPAASAGFNRIAVTTQGYLFVINSELGEIHAVNLRRPTDEPSVGILAESLPGRSIAPVAIASASRDLFVLDRAHRILAKFTGANAPLQFARSMALSGDPDDMCVMGGRIYVLDSGNDTVHVVSQSLSELDGFPISQIGTPFPGLARKMERKRLVCAGEANILLIVPVFRGLVLAVSPDGTERWRTHLRAYRSIIVRPLGGSAVMIGAPPGGYHRAAAGLAIGRERVLIQRDIVTKNGTASRETRLLNLVNGTELGTLRGMQPIVGSTTGAALFATPTALKLHLYSRRVVQ